MSDQCGDDADDNAAMLFRALAPHIAAADAFYAPHSVYDAASAAAATTEVPAKSGAPLPAQPNLTFVGDFTATEQVLSLIAQGSSYVNGDPCCTSTAAVPQCQIQTQHRGGTPHARLKPGAARSRLSLLAAGLPLAAACF